MMKRLLFMLAFLVSFGFAAVGQESVDPSNEESSNNTEQNETTPQGPLEKSVNLPTDGASLAEALGDDVAKVTKLIVSGTLTEADFATMKGMSALKIIDMAGVTQLPLDRNGLQMIPTEAFGGDNPKYGLEKVILPACLEIISSNAFQSCTNLSTIDFSLATQLKTIEYAAFNCCSGIVDLNLSNCTSLQYIHNNAFSGCNGLKTIDLSHCTELREIQSGVFMSCSALNTVNLEYCSNLTLIGDYAFHSCQKLTEVKLTGCTALSTIADCAFWNGSFANESFDFDFTQLTSLSSIGANAFRGKGLNGDINFTSKIHQVGESAFINCKKITSISFANCTDLGVISSNTFSDCDLLESVDFTGCSNLSTLQKNAFTNCPSLKRVIIDNNYYKSTDDALFKLKNAATEYETLQLYPAGKIDASYTIPSTTEIISENAFQYNTNLKEVTIPSNVLRIETNAFGASPRYGDKMNLKVTMESAQPIGLSESIGLENSIIFVPEEGLEKYKEAPVWKDYRIIKVGGSEIFEINLDGTQSLANQLTGIVTDMITQIKITGNVKSSDFPTLKQMRNLMKLDLSGASLENNIVPNEAFYEHTTIEEVILPTTVETINQWAFHSCSSLKSINLNELTSLTRIEQSAFINCSSLPIELVLPNSIKYLGFRAFYGTNISTIDFSNTNIEIIASEAFRYCPITGSLSFPASLNSIKSYAFEQANVTEIHLKSISTFLEQGNFSSTNKEECSIYVPYGSITNYNSSDYWRDFSNIVEEEAPAGESLEITLTEKGSLENYLTINEIDVENVTELTILGPMNSQDLKQICTMTQLQKLNMLNTQLENNQLPYQAFSNYYSGTNLKFLTEVILPKELVSIETWAFYGLSRLKKVVLPSTLKRLNGFSICSMLSDINIADCSSLEYIGGFDGCTSLPSTLILPNTIKELGSFSGSSITYIDLSQTSIETIDRYAFSNCQLTGDWDFPGSLSYIGEGAFNSAQFSSIKLRNLDVVRLEMKNMFPAVDLNTFKIYVPNSLVDTYKNNTYWYQYKDNIEGFGEPITVTPNNSKWGNVTGSGAYEIGDEVILKANCNDYGYYEGEFYWYGYVNLFAKWENVEEDKQQQSTYMFIYDGTEKSFVARFEHIVFKDPNDYTDIQFVCADEKSITVKVNYSNLGSNIFTGWYEDDVCISKDLTLTVHVKDGSKERVISPRFEGKTNSFGNTTISDANKVDGQDVSLYYNVTVSGDATWKPNSIYMALPHSSVLVESPIETSTINLDLNETYDWRYIYLPYNLNVADIQCANEGDVAYSQFVVRYYDGEERAKNGTGNSWKQLKTTDKLEIGKGYIFRTNNGAAYKLNASSGMEALLTNQPVTIPLSKHTSVAAPDANWNLIGNPYPCYYNIGTLYDNGFKGTITVWDPQLDNYQYYTQDDADQYLKPLTAFFVQQTDEVASILFTTSGRAAKLPEGTTRSASALRSGDGRQVLNLVLSNDSLSDKTRIVFNEAAKAGYELGLDASKFRSMNPNAPAFYSIDADNQQLAINERPWDNGVVRLGCNFGVKGEYSIALQETVEQDLILVDKVTGAQTNLKEQAYRFSAEVGESNDRFELRSGNPTGTEQIAGFQWQVRGGQLFLTGLPTNARVIVHDTMGRTVCDRTVSDELSGLALPQAGVYYLTIRTQQATRTERIMVKE